MEEHKKNINNHPKESNLKVHKGALQRISQRITKASMVLIEIGRARKLTRFRY